TNDYITNIGTLNTATGWESSDTSYNSAGQRTSYETYAGDANASGIDEETGFTTFNPSTTWESSYTAFNSNGQETSYETFAGSANSS
ncbi:hypothetical protein, partial [Burkholderia multivorans]